MTQGTDILSGLFDTGQQCCRIDWPPESPDNRAEMSPEAAGIAACLMTYSHHACRTECYAMTVHYYRLRDYALQHPECSAIMRIID